MKLSVGAAKANSYGGPPRVDLLPQEIKDSRVAARQRGWMTVGVVAAIGLTAGAFFVSGQVAQNAQEALEREQERTIALLAQQAEYAEVRTISATSELITAAQQAGALTEIQWRPLVAEVQATLPAGVVIIEFSINSASPIATIPQPGSPLLGERTATLAFTAESPDLPNVRAWLDNLTQVTGFTDATPGSVQLNEGTGAYEVSITMGVNETARSGRFAPPDDSAAEAEQAEAEQADESGADQ